jgi:triosephosphate isomerase
MEDVMKYNSIIMKSLLIAGNWKSNKTNEQAREWVQHIHLPESLPEQVTILLCVPFTTLSVLQWSVGQQKLPVSIAAQNVSKFDAGSYTGEVNAVQLAELTQWVLVGHSERRTYLSESDADLSMKVQRAKEAGLRVIYCVSDAQAVVPDAVDVIAYEPVWAIGTGKAETPENAEDVCAAIKQRTSAKIVLYGGSVDDANVGSFVGMPHIDGVLVGGASLDPIGFSRLITAAIAATK